MKFVKGISFFVIYPMLLLGTGFFLGVEAMLFFYPGTVGDKVQESTPAPIDWPEYIEAGFKDQDPKEEENSFRPARQNEAEENNTAAQNTTAQNAAQQDPAVLEAASSSETLSVDTEYVLEETDVLNHSVVETVWKLPHKYIGMNREQFLAAMESYAAYPPLSEKERGFVGLEVLSFSREKVIVQMNYQYLQPGDGFYLAVENNEIVVYLEDQKTIYINTGILLDTLPEQVQRQIIEMIWVEDEESLYDFLEAYSS